ncbi:MAG: PGF-pre-PGF domain-containing protein [Halorubrum sp.]
MSTTNGRTAVVITVVLCVLAAFAGAPAVAASDGPPPTPPAYFGSVEIDGEPAPEGVEVTVHVDGEERGSITTSEEGQYGGPSAFDAKLVADGTAEDEGESVQFRVNGELAEADPAVEWSPGEVRNVDLAVGDDADPGDPGDGDDPDGGTGGGGGGIGAAPPQTGDGPETIQAGVDVTDGVAIVEADESLDAGDTVESTLPDDIGTETTALDELSVTLDDSIDGFTLESQSFEERPAEVDEHGSAELLAHYSLSPTTFDADAVETATLSFQVDTEAAGMDPGDVAMYRYTGSTWEELPTTYHGDGEFEAETTGFSQFAIGGTQSSVTVVDATLGAAEVEPESTVEVTAQVENGGDADGTATVALVVDREIVDDREVTVPPGETRQLTFTPTFAGEGEYDVSVESADAGTLTVTSETDEEAETPTETDDAAEGTADDSTDEAFGTGVKAVIGLIGLALVVVGGGLLVRRR